MKINFTKFSQVEKYLPFIRVKGDKCARCGGRTYRSQASVMLCSICERTYNIEFVGGSTRVLTILEEQHD